MTGLNAVKCFLESYTIVYVLGVMALNIPAAITGQTALVKEYYGTGLKAFVYDGFLVAIYLAIGQAVAGRLRTTGLWSTAGTVAATSLALSTGFWLYFTRRPVVKSSFFSRWFHSAGFSAAVYDAVYLFLVSAGKGLLCHGTKV